MKGGSPTSRAMKGRSLRFAARGLPKVMTARMKRQPPASSTMAASWRVWLLQPAFDQRRAPGGSLRREIPFKYFHHRASPAIVVQGLYWALRSSIAHR